MRKAKIAIILDCYVPLEELKKYEEILKAVLSLRVLPECIKISSGYLEK